MKTPQVILGIALLSLSMCVSASDEKTLREFKTVLWPQAYRTQDVELLDSMLLTSLVLEKVLPPPARWTTSQLRR